MITWIFGNSGAGKTTLAEVIKYSKSNADNPYHDAILLDGDSVRGIWTDLGLSKEDRWEQNLRVARLAKMLDSQNHNVIVSTICPYRELRDEVYKITNCKFIFIDGGKSGKDYPFEK